MRLVDNRHRYNCTKYARIVHNKGASLHILDGQFIDACSLRQCVHLLRKPRQRILIQSPVFPQRKRETRGLRCGSGGWNVPAEAFAGGKARRWASRGAILRPVSQWRAMRIASPNWPTVTLERSPRRLGRTHGAMCGQYPCAVRPSEMEVIRDQF